MSVSDKFKSLLLKYVTIPAVLIAGKGLTEHNPSPVDKNIAPKETVHLPKASLKVDSVANATRDIVFQTDTLDVPPFAAMYHVNNKIIRNFVPGHSGYWLNLSTLAHEQKHKDNYNKKMRFQLLTPMQYAKMCMHDEISANICELLTLRYEYLASETPEAKDSVLQKYNKGRFGYYFQAVEQGRICPEKKDAKSRKDEWTFIARETQKMWMERLAPVYLSCITRMVERYLERYPANYSQMQTDRGYNNVCRIAYNIGGVDFGKYMKQDIEISDETLTMMQHISNIDVGKGNKKEYFQRVKSSINKLKQQGYPLSKNMIPHLYLAEGIKTALKGISKDVLLQNPSVVSACYNKMYQQISTSKEAKDLFMTTLTNEGCSVTKMNTPVSKDVLAKIYAHKDINLSEMIFGFNPVMIENGLFNGAFPVNDSFLQMELESMRSCSVDEKGPQKQEPAHKEPAAKPRRSEKMSFAAPNFAQPILVAATAEQEEEIYNSIRTFAKIPKVMRGCDLEAQAAYLKAQSRQQR